MTTHIERDGAALCGAADGELVPLDQALDPEGRHFNCVACHKALTDGLRHSRAEQ